MEILEGEELYRALLQRYSKKPRGWSFTVSQSPNNGFFDALVAGPDDSWQLKLDTIFKPSPFVLGSKTDQTKSTSSGGPISFGFRRIDPQAVPALLEGSAERMNKLLAFLQSTSPVAPTSSGNYLQGPFVFTTPGQVEGSLSVEQQSVDRRLSAEMLKLVRRRYPNYF
jgi:hypothetical protein